METFRMKEHDIKCWPPYFAEVLCGLKPFEIRFNDRDYQPGDVLRMREYDPENEDYTGSWLIGYVGSVYENAPGLLPGYVAMTVTVVDADDDNKEFLWKPKETADASATLNTHPLN